jgi:hypothetical protein
MALRLNGKQALRSARIVGNLRCPRNGKRTVVVCR